MALEEQVNEHLESMYQIWEPLSPERKRELWIVELARGIGRRQKDADAVKEQRRLLKQENANLRSQVEHLNRLQQPREFRVAVPATIPIEESVLAYLFGTPALRAREGIGLNADGRHMDLSTVVSIAIERWKSVIVSSRTQGMAGQKPLDQIVLTPPQISTVAPAHTRADTMQQVKPTAQHTSSKAAHNHSLQQQRQQQQQHQEEPQQEEQHTAATVLVNQGSDAVQSAAATPVLETSTTPVEKEASNDDSDEDADADMDEDESYHQSSTVKVDPIHQQRHGSVTRTKAFQNGVVASVNNHYIPNGQGDSRRPAVPNMGMAVTIQQQQPQQGIYNNFGTASGTDGDPMYMD